MKQHLTKVFGDPQARTIKRLEKRVKVVNELADKYRAMKTPELKKQTDVLKKRLAKKGVKLDDILPDAFALVREAADRKLSMRHFDVQLVGGIALHEGNVAEMKTGEGKTLVATAPVYLNALSGKGVHVVTVNDYLAQRDAGWMGQLYDFLGLTTGVIVNDQSFLVDPSYDNSDHDDPRMKLLRPVSRKEAYAADITYGTNNEFGFDYLRDNMVNDVDLLRQRELNFAIVDEVDSILIDEARTPLIISAPASETPELYQKFAAVAKSLKPENYILDEKRRSVSLSESGVDRVEKALGVKNFYNPENVRNVYHMDQALKAQALFKRDKDYVVTSDGEVIIVDEFTGRLMHGRRYNEGLHQAIEAKESVTVQQESSTLATISFQNYFRLYDKLSGMTGTAFTEAEEFQQIYGLDVIVVPSNRPLARQDKSDKIFKSEAGKVKALVADVKKFNEEGRPVLIGTASITKNELISKALTKAKIPHELLNAKNNEREATIVAKAGEQGAVTLATNIAGRGTDIVLGEGVKERGGLVVLGSERHEARRIDNQLRGRGGRQGDPGLTQFYVSTEDDLMRIFQGERIAALMDRLGVPDDEAIENKAVSKTLESAQKRVEGYHYDTRKNVVQYDNVINRHRKVVYKVRREILEGENIKPEVDKLIEARLKELTVVPAKNNPKFKDELEAVIPLGPKAIAKIGAEKNDKKRLELAVEAVSKLYVAKEKELGEEIMRGVEREVYLQVLDVLWMQHLENMQHLREGIHWRSVGQRDPLVEYRSESQKLFESLQRTLQDEVLRAIMHVHLADINQQAVTDEKYDSELTQAAGNSVEQGVNEAGAPTTRGDQDFKVKKAQTKTTAKKKTKKKRKAAKAARKRH
ncbi:MAG TPA: preprotein translocase subunit SecA [Candidatus Saccharimonadales bacterium]|nr:preprotein translocase subunit SecA [Candidatus Saccharimonadales bacterium]